VVITDNVAEVAYTYPWQPLFRLEHIDNLTFLRNTVPYAGGGAGRIADCTNVVEDIP